MANGVVGPRPDPDVLNRALLELASGDPEWVLVDRRVLRVLMGPLADLLVQVPYQAGGSIPGAPGGDEPYVWDYDDPCD